MNPTRPHSSSILGHAARLDPSDTQDSTYPAAAGALSRVGHKLKLRVDNVAVNLRLVHQTHRFLSVDKVLVRNVGVASTQCKEGRGRVSCV
jgi:hypothetical protein